MPEEKICRVVPDNFSLLLRKARVFFFCHSPPISKRDSEKAVTVSSSTLDLSAMAPRLPRLAARPRAGRAETAAAAAAAGWPLLVVR